MKTSAQKAFSMQFVIFKYPALLILLCGPFVYNHARNYYDFDRYSLNISEKIINVNWVPFVTLSRTLDGGNYWLKITFFAVMALLSLFILQQFRLKKGWYFWASMAGITAAIELLHLFTGGDMFNPPYHVWFDINNFFFYAAGTLIGWGLWQGAKRLAASIEIVD